MNLTTMEDWEKRFDTKFSLPPDFVEATAGNDYVPYRKYFITFPQEIKQFFKQELLRQSEENEKLLEEERKKKVVYVCPEDKCETCHGND